MSPAMKITRNNILKIWAALSVVLIGLYIVSAMINTGETFFMLLNGINFLALIFAFIFRNQLGRAYLNLSKQYQSIQNNSSKNKIEISYRNEKKIGRTLLALIIMFGLYATTLSVIDPLAYRMLINEDGIIEYGSAFCWLLAALLLTLSIATAKRKRTANYQKLPAILLVAFFIVCGGEEISWGQRIFDIGTPDFLKTVNVQNELTLHNIGSISVFSNIFFLITLIFFIIAPFTKNKNFTIGILADSYELPFPNRYASMAFIISLIIWVFIGVRFGTLGFHPFSFYTENYYTQMDDEIFEFMAAYSFFAFALLESRKTSQSASSDNR